MYMYIQIILHKLIMVEIFSTINIGYSMILRNLLHYYCFLYNHILTVNNALDKVIKQHKHKSIST